LVVVGRDVAKDMRDQIPPRVAEEGDAKIFSFQEFFGNAHPVALSDGPRTIVSRSAARDQMLPGDRCRSNRLLLLRCNGHADFACTSRRAEAAARTRWTRRACQRVADIVGESSRLRVGRAAMSWRCCWRTLVPPACMRAP